MPECKQGVFLIKSQHLQSLLNPGRRHPQEVMCFGLTVRENTRAALTGQIQCIAHYFTCLLPLRVTLKRDHLVFHDNCNKVLQIN